MNSPAWMWSKRTGWRSEAARNSEQVDTAQAAIEQTLAPDRPMSAWMRRSLGIAPNSPVLSLH